MKIRDILDRKGRQVVTVSPERTVREAVGLLVDHDIGSLVVTNSGEVRGIVTERDALRLAARDPEGWPEISVSEVMTEELLVAVQDDQLDYIREIMTENKVRHLPIVEDGDLKGIVSIGDVVNASRRDVKAENRYLRQYIRGDVR
ncbi:MAG: CBS domain-containing protein [Candidatus Palauibacterales bacterium]|nr:CBS domain-containing protein [Candidatus Palauibacterales bacterium]